MNTEDRELLELAAKAAGVVGEVFEYGNGQVCIHVPRDTSYGFGYSIWDPLEGDGDAFRLMVALCMTVGAAPNYPLLAERWAGISPDLVCREEDGNDHAAATRRAITRAAAEIGREMA